MILLRRILPFLVPTIIALLMSRLIIDPTEWRSIVISIAAVILVSIILMTQWHILSSDFWGMLFPLFSFFLGGIGLLFFVNIPELQWIMSAVLVLLCALYIENVFVFYYQPQKYTVLSLPNLSFFLNIFTAFTLFSFVYALELINLTSLWHILLVATLFSFFFFLHLLWSYKLLQKKNLSLLFIGTVIMVECIGVLQLWPVAYYVKGVIIAIIFFLFGSCMQLALRQLLAKKIILQYTLMCALSLLAVLLTARWFN